jgi:hypothetical protein
VQLAVGFGVDTSRSPNREIMGLWRGYLRGRTDSTRPHPAWSRAEQAQWPIFDLVSPYVYQGFSHYTVVHLAPAVGLDSTYLIRTLVSAVNDSTQDVRPLALYSVYAAREGGRWVLANALPRLTRTWPHVRMGHVTFAYPPARRVDRGRLQSTARFVDSLARAFDVQVPDTIRYYFTDDLIDTFHALGIDFFPTGPDTVGGRAVPQNRLVLVGSSTSGETYRHEVAHVILGEGVVSSNTAGLVAEGLMTWTGGSAGLSFAELLPGLRDYVRVHPDITLDGILTNPPLRDGTLDVGYDGLAVLCEMIHDKGGIPAIRRLVSAGTDPEQVLNVAAEILAVPRPELDELWRQRIMTSRARANR